MARESHPPVRNPDQISPAQARAARVALGLTTAGLAVMVDESERRIDNFEIGCIGDGRLSRRVRQIFESRGAAFVRDGDLEAIVIRRTA